MRCAGQRRRPAPDTSRTQISDGRHWDAQSHTFLSELELAGAQDGCVCWALQIFILLAASDTKRLHNLSGGVSLGRHFLIMLQLCTLTFSRVAIHATAGLGLWRCSDSSNSIFRFKLVIFSIPNKYDLISRRASLFIVLFHPVHTYYSMFCRSHDWKIAVLDYFNIALFPVLPKQLANCRGHCSFVGLDYARNGIGKCETASSQQEHVWW